MRLRLPASLFLLLVVLWGAAGRSRAGTGAPSLKFSETVKTKVSSYVDEDTGAQVHDPRVVSSWKVVAKISAAPGTVSAESLIHVRIGEAEWTADPAADPRWKPKRRSARIVLERDDSGRTVVLCLASWTAASAALTITGTSSMVGAAHYGEDTGTLSETLPVCVRVGAAIQTYSVPVGGTIATTDRVYRDRDGDIVDELALTTVRASGAGVPSTSDDPPAVTVTAPADGVTTRDPVIELRGGAADESAIVRVTYALDGGAETDLAISPEESECGGDQAPFTGSVTVTAEGPHTIDVRAYDDAGQSSVVRRSVVYEKVRIRKVVPVAGWGVGDFFFSCVLIDDRGQLWLQLPAPDDSTPDPNDGAPSAATRKVPGVSGAVDVRNYGPYGGGFSTAMIVLLEDGRFILINAFGVIDDSVVSVPGAVEFDYRVVQNNGGATGTGIARTSDGHVVTWGSGDGYAIGDGTGWDHDTAVEIATGTLQADWLFGNSFAGGAIVTSGGDLKLWGSDSKYWLRLPDDARRPTAVAGLTNVARVFRPNGIIHDTMFVLANDDRLFALGSRGYSGDGSVPDGYGGPDSDTPWEIPGAAGLRSFACDGNRALRFGVMADRTVAGWGDNRSDDHVGLGTYGSDVLVPTTIPGLSGAVRVVVRDARVVALRDDATVMGWGGVEERRAYLDASGDPTPLVTTPIAVPGVTGVQDVVVHEGMGYALTGEGTVWCWRTDLPTYHPFAITIRDSGTSGTSGGRSLPCR